MQGGLDRVVDGGGGRGHHWRGRGDGDPGVGVGHLLGGGGDCGPAVVAAAAAVVVLPDVVGADGLELGKVVVKVLLVQCGRGRGFCGRRVTDDGGDHVGAEVLEVVVQVLGAVAAAVATVAVLLLKDTHFIARLEVCV